MTTPTFSLEKIQKTITDALDSVHLLEQGKPDFLTQEEWVTSYNANVEHLNTIRNKFPEQSMPEIDAALIQFPLLT